MVRLARRRCLLCLLLIAPSPLRADEAVIYREVIPRETRSGLIELRRAYEARLPVAAACEEQGGRCAVEETFEVVYRVDFVEELRRASPEGLDVERNERGRVYVAVSMDADDERDYEDLLRRLLRSRRASSFGEPLARLGPATPPFDLTSIGSRATSAAWICFDDGGAGDLWVYEKRNPKQGGSSGTSLGGTRIGAKRFAEAFCAAADSVTSIAAARTWRTMPVPVTEFEESVSVRWSDNLRGEPTKEDLFAWPAGTRVERRAAPGVTVGGSFRRGPAGCIPEASLVRDGQRLSSRAVPIELPLRQVAQNAWVSRWTVERRQRRLGALPREDPGERSQLVVVLMPALPPLDLDASPGDEREPLLQSVFDQQLFLARLAERLEGKQALDAGELGRLLASAPAGFVAGGWVMALCEPGGGARYFVPATGAGCTVTNADAFCAAAERELGG